jgi:hypothetical protein
MVPRYDRDHTQRENLLVSRTTDRCEAEVRVSERPRKHEIANADFLLGDPVVKSDFRRDRLNDEA